MVDQASYIKERKERPVINHEKESFLRINRDGGKSLFDNRFLSAIVSFLWALRLLSN
jgi:hypothetical protein